MPAPSMDQVVATITAAGVDLVALRAALDALPVGGFTSVTAATGAHWTRSDNANGGDYQRRSADAQTMVEAHVMPAGRVVLHTYTLVEAPAAPLYPLDGYRWVSTQDVTGKLKGAADPAVWAYLAQVAP